MRHQFLNFFRSFKLDCFQTFSGDKVLHEKSGSLVCVNNAQSPKTSGSSKEKNKTKTEIPKLSDFIQAQRCFQTVSSND